MSYVKIFLGTVILAMTLTAVPQELQHEAVAVNIEIPVRVFQGDDFIDNLSIRDFLVYEDGELQVIEAVYLIKRTSIAREEKPEASQKLFAPELNRQFILVFEVLNWLPRLSEALDYFFYYVYEPGDELIVTTPVTTYKLTDKKIQTELKGRLSDELKAKLRRDINIGSMEYKSMIRDMWSLEGIEGGAEVNVGSLQSDLYRQLRDYKFFDEKKMLGVSDYLKSLSGQKHVFLFYQKEQVPVPRGIGQPERLQFFELFKHVSFDVSRIKQTFSDSTISTHFLFLTNNVNSPVDVESIDGQNLGQADISADIFSAFNEIATTTGGLVISSANPYAAFRKASDASQNYYLLYYTPKDYASDGKFRNIRVEVKGKKYKVLHRAGYLAD
ncbi:MAG: hypothetical protein WBB73_07825 [Candidatus Aminicenantaceae bacterium]